MAEVILDSLSPASLGAGPASLEGDNAYNWLPSQQKLSLTWNKELLKVPLFPKDPGASSPDELRALRRSLLVGLICLSDCVKVSGNGWEGSSSFLWLRDLEVFLLFGPLSCSENLSKTDSLFWQGPGLEVSGSHSQCALPEQEC